MGKNGSAQNMDCLTMGNWNTILLLWQKCSFVTYLLAKKKKKCSAIDLINYQKIIIYKHGDATMCSTCN